ncbi:MAG TPA: Holliday junction resolvase RuvX [Longilinea sp.]|nr:Holliday junction resolvase RuvX [Longilinea sp.]
MSNLRVLAVDPGEKRIGVAISDPSGTIANPLTVIRHVSRLVDAAQIAGLAQENNAVEIVVGQALDDDGNQTPASRHAAKLAEAIQTQSDLPVSLWDESDSTNEAVAAKVALGVSRSKRGGHQDALAATVILQSFLDANSH